MASDALHVLRFRAGAHPCAVAAAAVRDFRPSHPATRHVAGLLGIAPAEGSDARRDVVLACGGRSYRLAVDGPVELVQLRRGDVLAAPRALAATIVPVVGFAQLAGDPQLLLLLDVAYLTQQLERPTSTSGVSRHDP